MVYTKEYRRHDPGKSVVYALLDCKQSQRRLQSKQYPSMP